MDQPWIPPTMYKTQWIARSISWGEAEWHEGSQSIADNFQLREIISWPHPHMTLFLYTLLFLPHMYVWITCEIHLASNSHKSPLYRCRRKVNFLQMRDIKYTKGRNTQRIHCLYLHRKVVSKISSLCLKMGVSGHLFQDLAWRPSKLLAILPTFVPQRIIYSRFYPHLTTF